MEEHTDTWFFADSGSNTQLQFDVCPTSCCTNAILVRVRCSLLLRSGCLSELTNRVLLLFSTCGRYRSASEDQTAFLAHLSKEAEKARRHYLCHWYVPHCGSTVAFAFAVNCWCVTRVSFSLCSRAQKKQNVLLWCDDN